MKSKEAVQTGTSNMQLFYMIFFYFFKKRVNWKVRRRCREVQVVCNCIATHPSLPSEDSSQEWETYVKKIKENETKITGRLWRKRMTWPLLGLMRLLGHCGGCLFTRCSFEKYLCVHVEHNLLKRTIYAKQFLATGGRKFQKNCFMALFLSFTSF